MKKALVILTSCIIVMLMSVSVCFGAETLEITQSSPKNGATGTSIENLSVKLWFNEPMYSEKYNNANKKCFQLTDSKGKKLPTIVSFNKEDDYKNQVLVLLDTTSKYKVKDSTKYKLIISDKLRSANGNTLNQKTLKDYGEFSFTTLNQKRAMAVNMLLMVVIMVVMMWATMRSTKKSEEENKKKQNQKVNPYKEAKRTGKSVEEIVAKDQKNKAKQAAKEAKEKEKAEASHVEEKEDDPGIMRVSRPRPIAEAGGKHKSGKKAEAERKAKEEAAKKAKGTTNPKNKGKKKKKK